MKGKDINERNCRTKLVFGEEKKASSDRICLGRINVKGFIELFI